MTKARADESSIPSRFYDDAALPEEPPGGFYPVGESIAAGGTDHIQERGDLRGGRCAAALHHRADHSLGFHLHGHREAPEPGNTGFNVVAALAIATGRKAFSIWTWRKGASPISRAENPDDIRMRLKIAAYLLGVDLDALGEF